MNGCLKTYASFNAFLQQLRTLKTSELCDQSKLYGDWPIVSGEMRQAVGKTAEGLRFRRAHVRID